MRWGCRNLSNNKIEYGNETGHRRTTVPLLVSCFIVNHVFYGVRHL